MADAPTAPAAPAAPVIPVEDASSTQAELDAKISEELGIPPVKDETPDETPAEEPAEEEPSTPAEPEEPGEEEQPAPAEEEEEPVPDEEEQPPTPPATPSEELFIEVVDAEGVTHKISKASDLPKDFQFGTEVNLLDTLDRLRDLKEQQTQAETDKVAAEQAAQVKQFETEQYKSWDAEIKELAKTDRIDVKDADYLNDVFGHMNEINAARQKAGNPNLITSFEDALDKYEVKVAKDKAEADKVKGNDIAKAKSGVIGRSSAKSGADNYVYRAGSARSIDDIPVG